MLADVYWDSTRKIFSVKSQGKVILKSCYLEVRNAQFVVSESARQRVLKSGKKTPHAFIRGEVREGRLLRVKPNTVKFGYRPELSGHFQAGEMGLAGAKTVYLEAGLHPTCYAVEPTWKP